VARAAVLGRLSWLVAEVTDLRDETATARTMRLNIPGWPGHLAGQHVDVRLTAPDGYMAERSYSVASAPDGSTVELTVQLVRDGEVSGYLIGEARPGDRFELRGPIGGWFVWRPEQTEPVLLIAGGSGLVPLMSMIRARAGSGSRAPFRLIYSVREPSDALYVDELEALARDHDSVEVTWVWTRQAPGGSGRVPGRIDRDLIEASGWPPDLQPTVYVCGPTGFVEAASDLLVDLGHDPARIRTERFGPTGG
jgi:ferredoxin-NADP reductase